MHLSGAGGTPKTLSAGMGYRTPAGGRLAFRIDGRFTHVTENGGNAIGIGLSIGGVFGPR